MTFERYAPAHMRAQTFPLAEGDAGTSQTISAMRQLIEQGKKDPRIHELAARILTAARVPAEYTPAGEIAAARAIYGWGLANIRYTPDVTGKETLHSAWDVARLRIGDCDDFTVLYCSLFETIGKQTRIVTISSHAEDPNQFSHVYPEVLVRGGWIAMDAARKGAAFARGPEHWFRKRIWDSRSPEYADVAGLNGYAQRHALGYQPAMLPAAYRANVDPRFRRLRARAPMGPGNYGRPAVRRMQLGDDSGFNISSIAPLITAGTTGAANIIAASRANPANPFFLPTTSLVAPGLPGTYPYGMIPPGSPYASALSPFGAISPTTLLLLGGGLLLAVVASRH